MPARASAGLLPPVPPRTTGKTPLVIVDYLQIVAPYNERATDKQNMDKAVLELKRISRDFKLPVIAVSSLNRMSYGQRISMEAFKESGAIGQPPLQAAE